MITRKQDEQYTGKVEIDYNLVNDTDSYKVSHPDVYPEDMTAMLSYVEDRVGAKYPASLVFGLQYFLKRYFAGVVVTPESIQEEAKRMKWHGEPFSEKLWMHIAKDHGGRLPIRIRAVPEGSLVPVGNALRTIESTCPQCVWLPSTLETSMLRDWAPRSVATQGFFIKIMIREGLRKSSDHLDAALRYALHDFGSRGVTCPEQAAVNGMAHLVNFFGTDTKIAMRFTEAFYHAGENYAHSVPALEHSNVMARTDAGGLITTKMKDQEEFFRLVMDLWASNGYKLASFISDTYDVSYTIREQWCGSLLNQVKFLHEKYGFCVVVRLDSGNPVSEKVVRALRDFKEALGVTGNPKTGMYQNEKGYLMLPDFFRLLQGDGVSAETILDIDHAVMAAGFSTENISTRGMGGKNLHSGTNRDTQRTAQKPSIVCRNGIWHEVMKSPLDDLGKRSKGGWLDLVGDGIHYETVKVPPQTTHEKSALVTVFENGIVTTEWTLAEIRERAEQAAARTQTFYPFAGE